jgi:hypothetical protein
MIARRGARNRNKAKVQHMIAPFFLEKRAFAFPTCAQQRLSEGVLQMSAHRHFTRMLDLPHA